jgi:ATP-dependent RNA helicase RhlE
MQSFAELGVSERVIEALARRDIHAPFPIQALVAKDALAGRDVLAKSRTGSGKTLGFALPIVERIESSGPTPAALVLVPTRELAVQVKDEFTDIAKAKNLRVTAVYGGVGIPEQAKSASRAHIVIATPGRLQDLIQRRLLSLKGVRILVLDEADRMLDMGFQPQVDRIVDRLTEDRQTMFFSATLDGEVGRLAKAYTRDAQLHEVASKTQTVDEAEHRFVPVTSGDKGGALVDLLKKEDVGTSLVFVRTKRGADRLAQRLVKSGIKAVAMHGDLTQSARQRALKGAGSRRHHSGRELRPTGGPQGLPAPHRSHRPRRSQGHRGNAGHARAAVRGEPDRLSSGPRDRVQEGGLAGAACPTGLLFSQGPQVDDAAEAQAQVLAQAPALLLGTLALLRTGSRQR